MPRLTGAMRHRAGRPVGLQSAGTIKEIGEGSGLAWGDAPNSRFGITISLNLRTCCTSPRTRLKLANPLRASRDK